MRKNVIIFIVIAFAVTMTGCNEEESKLTRYNIGTASYKPSFLFSDESVDYIEKTLTLDFNEDAKLDESKAIIQLCDAKYNLLDMEKFYVAIEEKELTRSEFEVNSRQGAVKMRIGCRPGVKSGNKQIMVRIKNNGDLDYINDLDASKASTEGIMRIDFEYDESMNTLAFALMLAAGAILLWRIILRRIFFKQFRAIKKMMIIPNQAPISLRFKGKRMIVIDHQHHKQSLWNRFFTGEIQYIQNPSITTKITLKPVRRGKQIIFISKSTNYVCTPNPIGLPPSTVRDIINNVTIFIQ